jgi:hypothetical protein
MDSLLVFIWYAAWVIGISAFIVAWLSTASVLIKTFSALLKGKEDYSENRNDRVDPQDHSKKDASRFLTEKIRRISWLIFFACFLVLLMINANQLVGQ